FEGELADRGLEFAFAAPEELQDLALIGVFVCLSLRYALGALADCQTEMPAIDPEPRYIAVLVGSRDFVPAVVVFCALNDADDLERLAAQGAARAQPQRCHSCEVIRQVPLPANQP